MLQLPEYQDAERLSIFLSMPDREVSTTEIVKDALRQGKTVFVPYIHSTKHNPKEKLMDMLQLKDEQDLQNLKPDAWGIPSLSADDVSNRNNARGGTGILDDRDAASISPILDVVFMPGMAFDIRNNRLGHGKGFYDKYLSRIDHAHATSSDLARSPKLGV